MLAILTTHPIQYQVPLWQALARNGGVPFEVWYLSRHGAKTSRDREFGKSFAWDLDMLSGYPHRFLDVDPGATPTEFWKCRLRESLADRMREAGVKALWIQGWQVAAYWQAAWAAKKIGAEVWLRGESNDLAPTPPFWKRTIKRAVLAQLFHRVDRFLYIGSANRRLYKKFGVARDRLYPAPYAVDNDRFAAQAEAIRGQRSVVRGQWSIPQDAFCVLFCGKFIPKKRPVDLVKAIQSLVHRLPRRSAANGGQPSLKVHLLFVGSGDLGAELRARCHVVFDADSPKSAGTPKHREGGSPKPALSGVERVTHHSSLPVASFVGFLNQTEISKAYVAADCLVLPSDYRETWGLVVNEAMASGLPSVISDQCGCAEDLGTQGSNAVFRCGDIAELADKLFRLATKRDRQMAPVQLPSFSATIATVVGLSG